MVRTLLIDENKFKTELYFHKLLLKYHKEKLLIWQPCRYPYKISPDFVNNGFFQMSMYLSETSARELLCCQIAQLDGLLWIVLKETSPVF